MIGINNSAFLFNNNSGMNSGLNFGNKSSNLASTFNFTDLAAIKNGTYKKLAQKQFDLNKASDSDSTNKKRVTKPGIASETNYKVKSSVDALKDSIKSLNDKDLWKQTNGSYDTEKITGAIKKFADKYNNVVDQTEASGSSTINQSARWMNSLTDTMKSALDKVGVKVGEDNKLTVDEDALKKADMNAVKTMFSGDFSYANQTGEKATSIASAAVSNTSMYTNTGAYASMMSNMFNTSI